MAVETAGNTAVWQTVHVLPLGSLLYLYLNTPAVLAAMKNTFGKPKAYRVKYGQTARPPVSIEPNQT